MNYTLKNFNNHIHFLNGNNIINFVHCDQIIFLKDLVQDSINKSNFHVVNQVQVCSTWKWD